MIIGHTPSVHRGAVIDATIYPPAHGVEIRCSCGKWSRRGERITALRTAFRRHLYDVSPKRGDQGETGK